MSQIGAVLLLLLLVIAILPLLAALRLILQPGIRSRLRGFPSTQRVIAVAIGACIIAAILAAMFFPAMVAAAAFASLAICFAELVRRRPSFGMKRGLPPGSLSMFSTAAWNKPDYYADGASAYGEIFKFQHLTRPAVAIVGIQTIEKFLRAHAQHIEVPPAPFNEIIPSGFVRYLSGTDHDRVASAIRTAMNSAVVAHHDRRIADEAAEAVGFLEAGSNVESVLEEMTLRIMLALFLDIDRSSDAKLRILFHDADYRRLSATGRTRAAGAVSEIVAEMRAAALDTSRMSFLSHLAKHDPAAINDDGILANLAYSLHTGRLDVAGLLHWITAVAGANPDLMQKLRDASDMNLDSARSIGGIADRMVRETLRLHQSEFLMRRTTKDILFNGYRIPAGWHVRLCIAESHRSAEAFPEPAVFDPDRFLESRARSTYAPFGFKPRACPGEHLARVIGRHFFVALARRPALEMSQDKPWEFTGFHWKPNSRMQLRLSPPS